MLCCVNNIDKQQKSISCSFTIHLPNQVLVCEQNNKTNT